MKIVGIGTDIIEIDRIETAINRTKNFKEKVFTKSEIDKIEKKKAVYPSYAGRFAAKEAISKALGTGIKGFGLLDIEILNDNKGKPYVNFKDVLIEFNQKYKIELSISHSREYAVATVLIYEA